jgi:hypothetical protein
MIPIAAISVVRRRRRPWVCALERGAQWVCRRITLSTHYPSTHYQRSRHLPPRNTRYQAAAKPYLDRTYTGWNTPASLAHLQHTYSLSGVLIFFSCNRYAGHRISSDVSLPCPRLDQSPGRKHLRPQMSCLAVATDERELPSRADQGSTLVGPQRAEGELGFSPCGTTE